MSLTSVWLQTAADGLVRADQVTGIDAHQTPALSGKPSRWLVDVVVPVSIGHGTREDWGVNVLHRTLIQISEDPGEAPVALARLLAQLDHVSAAGLIVTSCEGAAGNEPADGPADAASADPGGGMASGAGLVRFRFIPFSSAVPGHHADGEYL